MPVAIVRSDAHTLLARAWGDVTFSEVQRFVGELSRVTQTTGTVAILADCRGIQSTLSTAELRTVARDLRPYLRAGLPGIALVTDSSFMYGVGRMFAAFAELSDARVSVFRDFDEAQKWLETSSHPAS